MLHLDSEANTSSERRREPERTSKTSKHDAATDDQTERPDLSTGPAPCPDASDAPDMRSRSWRRNALASCGQICTPCI